MNRNVITLALALLCVAATAFADDVQFGSSAPVAAGTRWTDSSSYNTTVHASAPSPDTSRTTSRDKTCVVLSVDGGGRIDSVQVRYNAASNAAVAGKTYVVTTHGVTSATGAAVPESEAAFVQADNSGFGQFRALEQIFANTAFAIGEPFTPNRHAAEDLLNVPDRTRLDSITLTPRSIADGVAEFDVAMTLQGRPKKNKDGTIPDGAINLTINGTLRMDVQTVRPLSLQLRGTVTANTIHPTNTSTNSRVTTLMTTTYGF